MHVEVARGGLGRWRTVDAPPHDPVEGQAVTEVFRSHRSGRVVPVIGTIGTRATEEVPV
jgi:hypothetical protein